MLIQILSIKDGKEVGTRHAVYCNQSHSSYAYAKDGVSKTKSTIIESRNPQIHQISCLFSVLDQIISKATSTSLRFRCGFCRKFLRFVVVLNTSLVRELILQIRQRRGRVTGSGFSVVRSPFMALTWGSALRVSVLLILVAAIVLACYFLPVEKVRNLRNQGF